MRLEFFLCTVMLISFGSFFYMGFVKMMFVDPFEQQGKSHHCMGIFPHNFSLNIFKQINLLDRFEWGQGECRMSDDSFQVLHEHV